MKHKKNNLFLLLTLSDMNKNSNLYSDLVQEFVLRGENVFIVAPCRELNEPTHISNEKGIDVLRVKTMPLFGVGTIKKGIANLLLPYQFEKAIKKHFSGIRFDNIIIPTPPIMLESVVSKLKKKHNSKVYLILRDIFPQNAVDLGMMSKSSFLYKMFRRQECRLYKVSDSIGCMSQGNIDYIRKHNPEVAPEKLHILMNFQKVLPMEEHTTEDLKSKYGLQGKFVIIFGGNLGIPQKMENVVEFAKAISTDYKDVVLLLIGSGTQMDVVRQFARDIGVANIVIKDKIPRKDYGQLVMQCDLGLISLNERFTIPNIPSKTMAYFQAAIPVLASVDSATDYGVILEEHNMGLWSVAGDTEAMVSNFDRLYRDAELRHTMGINGRRFLEENMRVEVAYNIIKGNIL